MDFNLSDEQQMLRDGAMRYVRENYAFDARRKLEASELGYSADIWQQFAELGWLGLAVPEKFGGLGCSINETVILMEEFGRGLLLEPYLNTAVLGVRLLEQSENGDLQRELLPRVAEGSLKLALAHGESGSRYDLAQVSQTHAAMVGDSFVLDGRKIMVLDAPSVDRLIVSATTDGAESYSLFVVDARDAGVRMRPYKLIDGTRAADVELVKVTVPASALLAGADQASAIVEEAVDRATLAQTAEALGAMERVLDITSEYVKTRQQFGQPIGKFQALQHQLVDMFVEVQESRSALYQGIAYVDADLPQRQSAVSAAKVVAAKAGKIVGGSGIHLHGGIGMTEEYPVGHYFRKLIAFEMTFGDIDHHLRRFSYCSKTA